MTTKRLGRPPRISDEEMVELLRLRAAVRNAQRAYKTRMSELGYTIRALYGRLDTARKRRQRESEAEAGST